MRNTKKATSRLFFVAPRNWKIWVWVCSPFAVAGYTLIAMACLLLAARA